jgi:hypothetical protein
MRSPEVSPDGRFGCQSQTRMDIPGRFRKRENEAAPKERVSRAQHHCLFVPRWIGPRLRWPR